MVAVLDDESLDESFQSIWKAGARKDTDVPATGKKPKVSTGHFGFILKGYSPDLIN